MTSDQAADLLNIEQAHGLLLASCQYWLQICAFLLLIVIFFAAKRRT